VVRLLRRRLGQLPPGLDQRLGDLKIAQLEDLAEALLDFNSAADLEAWLTAQK